jgi:hypothetical protein
MNIRTSNRFLWLLGSLILISIACQGTSTPSPSASTQDKQPGQPPPAATEIKDVPVSLPEKRENQAGDPDSSPNANRKLVSAGEKFVRGLFERPFNAETMDTYFPYLDIVDTQGYKDNTWGFATISLSNIDANGALPGNYGVELDLNRDGRGEWLILAANPSSTDWSVQGVQAWTDANGDVGGRTPMSADENQPGDGYEVLVFDQGHGEYTDEVWVRVSADDPRTIAFAFSLAMLGNPDSYAMGAWAGSEMLDPALFDMNDHMTHMQAGSPLPDLFVYPLKELAEIDNTCRIAIGFVPTGSEPGLCQTFIPGEPGAPVVGCTPSFSVAGVPMYCP